MSKIKWGVGDFYWVDVSDGMAHLRLHPEVQFEVNVPNGGYRVCHTYYKEVTETIASIHQRIFEAIEKHNTALAATAGV